MKLSLCLHNHQPVGNFDHVIEKAYVECYEPVLSCLRRHPSVRLALHHSGCLLDWLEEHHPEYLERVSEMCREGQLELVSGGYYEPILPIFRRTDIRSQIRAMNDRLEKLGGSRPSGLWLTERVWEPSIPSFVAGTGIGYVIVDDLHLRLAGVDDASAGEPVLTEDSGHTTILLGSSRELRYAVPFMDVPGVSEILGRLARSGVSHVFYGDDGEKFGVWPGTWQRCHEQGWLDAFLSMIEGAAGWLETVLPCEAVSTLRPSGPCYIPASSYPEMGEWALSPDRQAAAGRLRDSIPPGTGADPDLYLRAGFWRNFLTRYPEANDLHKRVLHAEKAVRASGSGEALRHFWRSQCNCAYWHGVFGGLYLPHLRDAVWTELLESERKARIHLGTDPSIHHGDIDVDGSEEILIGTSCMSCEVRAGEGLAVSELSLLPEGRPALPLGNVLSRRREAYHSGISDEQSARGHDGTIHGDLPSLEQGLASRISIDPYRRLSFREVVLPGGDSRADWFGCSGSCIAAVTPGAVPEIVRTASDVHLSLGYAMPAGVLVEKELAISLHTPRISCRTEFEKADGMRVGCEMCFNLLTGSEDDRNVSIGGGSPVRTGLRGEGTAGGIVVTDGWRKVRIVIQSRNGIEFDVWHMPLDSVSRSERGYESVHQGIALLLSTEASGRTGIAFEVILEDMR